MYTLCFTQYLLSTVFLRLGGTTKRQARGWLVGHVTGPLRVKKCEVEGDKATLQCLDRLEISNVASITKNYLYKELATEKNLLPSLWHCHLYAEARFLHLGNHPFLSSHSPFLFSRQTLGLALPGLPHLTLADGHLRVLYNFSER